MLCERMGLLKSAADADGMRLRDEGRGEGGQGIAFLIPSFAIFIKHTI